MARKYLKSKKLNRLQILFDLSPSGDTIVCKSLLESYSKGHVMLP